MAPPHATIALARAVVGAMVAHVLAVRLYLYTATLLFPKRYKLSSLASIANTLDVSGVMVHAVDVVI